MENKEYHKLFWKHKVHAIFGGCCLAVVLLSGHLFGAILGISVYVAGIINIPDTKFFKNRVDKEAQEIEDEDQRAKAEEFRKKRDRMFMLLNDENRETYRKASSVCYDIEQGLGSGNDVAMILKKVDELMWTYLKLLSIRQSLEMFLQTENQKEIDKSIAIAQKEVDSLAKEIDQLKEAGNLDAVDHKQKLLLSVEEKKNTIKKRADRYTEAGNNVEIVKCEEERLLEQIRLVRADAIATKNAEGLSLKIDSTIAHLGETNKWLSELQDYRDISDEIPQGPQRVGYGESRTGGDGSYKTGPQIEYCATSSFTKSDSSYRNLAEVVDEVRRPIKRAMKTISINGRN
jgi:hypothetical protein